MLESQLLTWTVKDDNSVSRIAASTILALQLSAHMVSPCPGAAGAVGGLEEGLVRNPRPKSANN